MCNVITGDFEWCIIIITTYLYGLIVQKVIKGSEKRKEEEEKKNMLISLQRS